jgi:hypothetical protein
MDLAVALRDRLPKVAALFLSGELDGRRVWLIGQRTRLITDAKALAAVDSAIAERAITWGPLPEYKLIQALDVWVDAVDPGAVRRTRQSARSRDFTVGNDHESGTTAVWGRLFSTDAALLHQRVDAMTRGLCGDDPRTLAQRRADAVGALAAGSTQLACKCGRSDCPAIVHDGRASSILAGDSELSVALALLIAGDVSMWLTLGFPIWVLVVSALLLVRSGFIRDEQTPQVASAS